MSPFSRQEDGIMYTEVIDCVNFLTQQTDIDDEFHYVMNLQTFNSERMKFYQNTEGKIIMFINFKNYLRVFIL